MRTGQVVEVIEVEPAWLTSPQPGDGGLEERSAPPTPAAAAEEHRPVAAVAPVRHR